MRAVGRKEDESMVEKAAPRASDDEDRALKE